MRRLTIVLSLLLCAGLTGCFSIPAEDLLAQPRQPLDSVRLRERIDEQQMAGAQLLSPESGLNRPAIQKVDIDGDGDEETVVFFRTQEEKPLRIQFYKKSDEGFEAFAHIESEGQEIESVTYSDLNQNGVMEILVVWRMGQGTLKALTVHTLIEGQMRQILSISCDAFALQDFFMDKNQQLLVLRQEEDTQANVAEVYDFDGIEMTLDSRALMSANIESIQRARTGMLSDGHPAVFVTSQWGGAGTLLTDIFAYRGGVLRNITLDEGTGVSEGTVRGYTTLANADIDRDGALEIPFSIALPPYHPDAEPPDALWTIMEWRSYTSDGSAHTVETTFHANTDGWYFIIPNNWLPTLTMTRRTFLAEERGYVFSALVEGQPPRDLLIIYTLTGDNRRELSAKNGWEVLLTRADTIVAVEIVSQNAKLYEIDIGDVRGRVRWIQIDWLTGELNQ